jgi:hypothetical protein
VFARALPTEPFEVPAVALSRTTAPVCANEDGLLPCRRRRAEVDGALGRLGSTEPLVDNSLYLEDAVPAVDPCFHSVTSSYLGGGLRRGAVDADVTAAASVGRSRTRLEEPNGPEPLVNSGGVHGIMLPPFHSETHSRPSERRAWPSTWKGCPGVLSSGRRQRTVELTELRAKVPHRDLMATPHVPVSFPKRACEARVTQPSLDVGNRVGVTPVAP